MEIRSPRKGLQPATAAPGDRPGFEGLSASLGLHICAGALVFWLQVAPQLAPQPLDAIIVDLVSAPVPARPLTERDPDARPNAPASVRAEEFLSAKALADPRSRGARMALRQMAAEDRIEQLCNIEAMEQLHHWKADLRPDSVVAYATADTKLADRTLLAEGAAFRSDAHWYRMRYTCAVSSDLEQVAAFEFLVGAEIARRDWQRLALPADAGPLD